LYKEWAYQEASVSGHRFDGALSAKGMPRFGRKLFMYRIGDVVQYVRSLKK